MGVGNGRLGVSVLWLMVTFEKERVLWIWVEVVVTESTLVVQGELRSSPGSGRGVEHTSLMGPEKPSWWN